MIPVILLAVLPIVAAWFWQRRTYGIRALFFAACLGSGILSLALAAVLQMVLPGAGGIKLLIKTALTEEAARFIALALLFWALKFSKKEKPTNMAVTAGMTAGLAFAAIETAAFAASDPLTGALRLVSADIIHAACGTRVAAAVLAVLSGKTLRCLAWVLMAAALHAIYNLMAPRGGVYMALAVLLAASSFVSGLRYGESETLN